MTLNIVEAIQHLQNQQDSVQFRAEGNEQLNYPSGAPLDGYGAFMLRVGMQNDDLPVWWSPARDYALRKFMHQNSLISGTVYGEATRVKNTPYTLIYEDKKGNRLNDVEKLELEYYQNLLLTADFGNGFRSLLTKLATDYLTQDNGFFIELLGDNEDTFITESDKPFQNRKWNIYQTPPLYDRPRGIAYLDAAQCWRTYDPDYPVVYTNPYYGSYRLMHWTRIIHRANFPQGVELGRGIGLCALSRAYQMAKIVQDVSIYKHEKITGQSPEIVMLQNVNIKDFQNALFVAGQKLDGNGYLRYKDTTFVGTNVSGPGAPAPEAKVLGLKSVPDGFDFEKDLTLSIYIIATAFGIDAREIFPATSSGSTRADAEIQDEKSAAKGQLDILQTIEDAINERIMPNYITYAFDLENLRTHERQAQANSLKAATYQNLVLSNIITVKEARQSLIEEGVIDNAFLEGETGVVSDGMEVQGTTQEAAPPQVAPTPPSKSEYYTTLNTNITDNQDQKDFANTASFFNSDLQNLITETTPFGGRINQGTFITRMGDILLRQGIQAYLDGLEDGGVKRPTAAKLTPDQTREMLNLIRVQQSYVKDFSRVIFAKPEPNLNVILNRLSLWINKGLQGIYQAAFTSAEGNKSLVWRLGRTERHCRTCLTANGQVHTAKAWKQANILPQGDNLECGGFRCDCRLEESELPLDEQTKLEAIPTLRGIGKKSFGFAWFMNAPDQEFHEFLYHTHE